MRGGKKRGAASAGRDGRRQSLQRAEELERERGRSYLVSKDASQDCDIFCFHFLNLFLEF